MIAFIWLGIRVGDRAWSEVDLETWLNKTSLTPGKVISGKMFATFIILALHYFIILPIIILATILWGVDWWIVVEINLLILIVTLFVTSFSMVFRPSENANMFLSVSFLVSILFVTLVLPKINYFNPFYQIWMIAKPGVNRGIWTCIALNLGLQLLIIKILYFILAREVKNKNERCNHL
jgi:hypothetical protein